jgi:pimeloyl-ACP methyl ester carboxylesterase
MKKARFASVLLFVSLLNSCDHKSPPAAEPNRDYSSSRYIRRSNAETVIVFVHGIFGGAIGTWTSRDTGAYWPQLLTGDPSFQNTDVYVYSYSTPYLSQSYTIDELIENMRLVLANDEVFQKHKKVVFLCHSMGGLIVRGFLKRYQVNAPQVPLIYFFSTPTSGAHITELTRFLSNNPQLRGMLPANSENYVSDLQRDWRALPFHVNSRCAYEKLDTYGYRIVDEQSASALCDGPVDPISANHIDIVKPADSTALSYIAFRQAFASIQQVSSPPETTVSGTIQTARSVVVDCGQVRDDNATIPPPIEIKPQQRVIDAVASLQEASNLKEQLVEAKGLLNQMARIHYRLVGLDRLVSGECPAKGFGIILVTFIVAQPRMMVTPGFTPITSNDSFVGLSGKSGTLRLLIHERIPSIDSPSVREKVFVDRGDVRIRDGIAENRNGLTNVEGAEGRRGPRSDTFAQPTIDTGPKRQF